MENIQVKIESPVKYYDFVDQHGEILATFRFVPSDLDIFDRHKKVLKSFEQMQAELNAALSRENELTEDEEFSMKKEYSERMKKELDYLFNSDTSGFFQVASPFTPLDDGEPWVLVIIQNVVKIVESVTGKNMAAMKNKAEKYTEKYKSAPGKYPFPVS